MQTQIESTIAGFGRSTPIVRPPYLIAALSTCFFAAAISAVSGQIWSLFGVFLVSTGGLSAALYVRLVRDRAGAASGRSKIDWQASIPEVQRQGVNIQVRELSDSLGTDEGQRNELLSAYIVAEDLALRQVQQEQNVPLMRHVQIGGIPFDAVYIKDELVVCVDVSFLVVPDIRQEKIDAMMRKAAAVSSGFESGSAGRSVRLLIVLVTQLTPEDDAKLRTVMRKGRFAATPVDIDIRMLDFEALQRVFLTD